MTLDFYFSGSQLSRLKSEEGEVNPWLPNLFLSMDTVLEWLLCIHPTYSSKADGTQATRVGAAARGKRCESPTRSPPARHHGLLKISGGSIGCNFQTPGFKDRHELRCLDCHLLVSCVFLGRWLSFAGRQILLL